MAYPSVFFTVVYPQALPYFKDVCHSAMQQTRQDFDLIVVNDGCDTAVLREHLAGLNATILDAAGTPTQNRQQGINYARKQNYKYIFFCDADDTFSANRFERTFTEFKNSNADIIVCNLNIVDETLNPIINSYFSKELPENQWIDGNFIKDKNIFGLSNTALRLDALQTEINIPETPIVDWYLFTILINNKLKARYITEPLVNYRQHNTNMIGINQHDLNSFRKMANLKNLHYKLLVKSGYHQYEDLYNKSKLLQNLSDIEITNIIKQQLAKHNQPLWWQVISNQ